MSKALQVQRELVRAIEQAPHGEFCALTLPGGEECDCWRAFALSRVPNGAGK